MSKSADQPDVGKPTFARRFAKWRLRFGISHLPELKLFPTEIERDSALFNLSRHPGSSTSTEWAIAFLFYVVFIVMTVTMSISLWRRSRWFELAGTLVTVIFLVYMFRQLIQGNNVRRYLRGRLIDCGVPICIPCGYLLKGLPDSTERCPECGKTFDPSVKKVMARTNASPGGESEQGP